MEKIIIHWFRRDLRLEDNHSLYQALTSGFKVVPVFIFDKNILNQLNKRDRRVSYIHSVLKRLNERLFEEYHSGIDFYYNTPEGAFEQILNKYKVHAVFTNKDYEPYAIQRDRLIQQLLHRKGVLFKTFKDHVIFGEKEIVKEDGHPYHVFTHYSNAWKKRLNTQLQKIPEYPSEKFLYYLNHFDQKSIIPELKEMSFEIASYIIHPVNINERSLLRYHQTRNIIWMSEGTTHASVYLRFGTLSTRYLIKMAINYSQKLLDELIWREFFQMILFHHPDSNDRNFNMRFYISWENNEEYFEKWMKGETGFPIVDAAIKELIQTGYMHNRCRMIVANFLTRILCIDWKWGEQYFAELLMDYDMAANVGNWQWSAGTGVDMASSFRIFNPFKQQEKFDPEFTYVKSWIPDFQPDKYLKPIVNYEERRRRALEMVKKSR
jgi:deoxyribodipyrimidine photo-lyase